MVAVLCIYFVGYFVRMLNFLILTAELTKYIHNTATMHTCYMNNENKQ